MIGWALRKSMATYTIEKCQNDLVAGLIVSLVALPLAMALSIAVGLPPQYGLYTAIVAGIIVPLLGGSIHQVSGPTAAFVVIIAPIVTVHGLRGLIITTIMAGLILVLAGIFNIGKYLRYIPYPVTTGFTSGIAIVIGVLSFNDFLGLHIKLPDNFFEKITTLIYAIKGQGIQWPDLIVGGVTLFFMGLSKYFHKQLPAPILGIIVGIAVSLLLTQNGLHIETIGTRFQYVLPDGQVGYGVPPFMPSFHLFGFSNSDLFIIPSLQELQNLFVPALVVAVLAALESILSAAVADGMAGTKHQSNAELVGIGIGNIMCGLASGIPATGALARTATNIQNGGKSPLAAMFHGVFILVYILFFSHLISYLPMSALAALLLMIAYRMSHITQFIRVIKIGSVEDSIALILCFIFTVCIDMVAGISIGVVTSCFLLIKRISGMTELKISIPKTKSFVQNNSLALSDETIVYHINGSIFFGNVEEVLEQIEFMNPNISKFVIDLMNVPFIDMTGLISLKRVLTDLCIHKKKVAVCAKKVVLDQIKKKMQSQESKIIYENNLESSLKAIAT